MLRVELRISNTMDPAAWYLGWSPVPCSALVVEEKKGTGAVRVRLRNLDPSRGGQVVFREPASLQWKDVAEFDVPLDGRPVALWVAGKFGFPSTSDRDAAIEVLEVSTGLSIGESRLMVRVRKDANRLTDAERDLFIDTLARLNDAGRGLFQTFREMHTTESTNEMHRVPAFLPWHRAYLLDLERELQIIEAAVTIPYWRFDRPASRIFSEFFMGAPDGLRARFHPRNPLDLWTTDFGRGVDRYEESRHPRPDECQTLVDPDGLETFSRFDRLQGGPHAEMHRRFQGFLSDLHQAARDPLFFLLHGNVDRLWAKWQWLHRRFDPADPESYDGSASEVGHRLADTLWPWNQVTRFPRPSTAPGGYFAESPTADAPGSTPSLSDMLDWQGWVDPANRLGFDYDDVPFQPDTGSVRDYRAEFIEQGPCSGYRPSGKEVRRDLESLRAALATLKNGDEPVSERRQCFAEVVAARVSLPSFPEVEAQFREVLRTLIDDLDEPIRLRAIHTLAAMKDDVVQERVVAGLEGREPARLSTEHAVVMLSYDVHAAHFPLLRHLAWTSDDLRTREAAIRALSQDPESVPRLRNAMSARTGPVEIRRSAALSLRALDPITFAEAACQVVLDETEDDGLRTSFAVALDLMDAPQLADSYLRDVVRSLRQ